MANWAELKKTKLYHNSGFSGKKGLLKKKKCSINFKSRLQYCPKGTTNGFSFRTAWGTFLDIYASLLSLLLRDQIGTSVFSILQWASLVAQSVKNLLAVQEIQVWSLGWEELLEKEMATHSRILAWRIPWTEEPGGLLGGRGRGGVTKSWIERVHECQTNSMNHLWLTKPKPFNKWIMQLTHSCMRKLNIEI